MTIFRCEWEGSTIGDIDYTIKLYWFQVVLANEELSGLSTFIFYVYLSKYKS